MFDSEAQDLIILLHQTDLMIILGLSLMMFILKFELDILSKKSYKLSNREAKHDSPTVIQYRFPQLMMSNTSFMT